MIQKVKEYIRKRRYESFMKKAMITGNIIRINDGNLDYYGQVLDFNSRELRFRTDTGYTRKVNVSFKHQEIQSYELAS